VRELRDVFYQEELHKWSEESSFDYQIYCSREASSLPEKHNQGRVTDSLKLSTLNSQLDIPNTEYYICGSPAMVTEVRSMLSLY
jgi:NAD(P)H-flavin reductase